MALATTDWLNRFFDAGNGWDLAKVRASGYPKELQLHLETMLAPAFQHQCPCVLPRLDADKQLWFYLVADDKRQLSELLAVMRAYLGAVRTKIDPQIHTSGTDAMETALLSRWPQGYLKISIPRELNSERDEVYSVFNTLNIAVARYAERPQSTTISLRPIGRILSDFFVACDRRDGKAADEMLEELKASGKLSARNLLSVELQALAARNEWKLVLSHPRLDDILSRRIPARVTELLLEALEHTEMRSDEPTDYEIGLLQARLETLSALFMRSPGLAACGNESLWKIWAIGAVALGYARAIETLPKEFLGPPWIARLGQWGGLLPKLDKVTSGIESTLNAAPTIDAAVNLLKRSLALDPKEGLSIYRRLCEFPIEIIQEIEAHRGLGSVWQTLQDDFSPQRNIDGWSAWLRSLLETGTDTISVQTLSEACRRWESNSWNEQSVSGQLLDLADTGNTRQFREGIPVLRKWLLDRQIQASASFTAQMILVLAVDNIYSTQDLVLVADLVTDLTSVGHTKEQYRESISAALEIWNRTKSIKSLDEGLDLLDVLLDSVCADQQARLSFWMALQQFCLTEWRRLSDEQQLLVREVSYDITGSNDQFVVKHGGATGISPKQVDAGKKKLAIYTLTEGAGRRAKAVLTELFPSLAIHLNHDKTATGSLINLANTADYFIFSSQSAAHQAFYPVIERRNDILYPAGKGSSSIVRCFLDAVAERDL